MKLSLKLSIAVISALLLGVTYINLASPSYASTPTPTNATPIIAFDDMQLSRNVAAQPDKALMTSIVQLVKTEFPGTTAIAVDTPMDSTSDMIAHGTTPSPLKVEQFIDMQLDVIHAAGFNAMIRSLPASVQGAYYFPVVQKTSEQWTTVDYNFLTYHKAHIKSGDIIALWYEIDGWRFSPAQSINDGDGSPKNDINTFLMDNVAMVNAFAKANNLSLRVKTSTNYSDTINSYIEPDVIQAQGAIVADDYGTQQTNNNTTFLETELASREDALYALYGGKYPYFQQEWSDIRNSTPSGTIQQQDPGFTARMANDVIFPRIKSGEMEGISFWNLTNTLGGILTINGDTATLNPVGVDLSNTFKKWF